MRDSILFFTFSTLLLIYVLRFQAHAAPAAPVIKHLTSIMKWTRPSSKTPKSDGNIVQFENGYLVETVVEGNELGMVPYSIRVSQEGELFAVDAVNSNIVRISPPLSQYSRARLVAGSFQGYTGHVDGKTNDARFNHPKGVTMDDKGNVYVADTSNLAIRKIGEAGVTTIAGGKSNVAGYSDGPSEDAKFSNDFDVIYVRPTCSLLVIDRGNAALRKISLNQQDCDFQYSSVSATDLMLVISAVFIGYAVCLLQQGFGPSFFSRMHLMETKSKEQWLTEKPNPTVETVKEEQEAGWPSFGQLILDLSKLTLEALANIFVSFTPFNLKSKSFRGGLTPLKDSFIMPEDESEPPLVQKQRSPAPLSETRQVHTPNAGDKYSEMKPAKIRSSSFKDPSLLSKHKASKRQECAEFYGASGEVPPYVKSKSSQKERPKHRQRDKSGEVIYGVAGSEQKPVDMKPVNYNDPKFGHYNIRNKYGDSFHYN